MQDLNITRKKLSLIFTAIVFLLAIAIECIYFSLRYFQWKRLDTMQFYTTVWEFEKDATHFFSKESRFPPFFSWRMIRSRGIGPLRFFDFMGINSQGEIVFEHLHDEERKSILFDFFRTWKKQYEDATYYYYRVVLSSSKETFHIVFLKPKTYAFHKYMEDMLLFFILILILSFWFYGVWYYYTGIVLEPIQRSMEDMDRFIHRAHHELKTPISVISSNLQLVKLLQQYDEELIASCIQEIKKMDALILALTYLSTISWIHSIQSLSLHKEIQAILEERKTIIDTYEVTVSYTCHEDTVLQANKEYFYILFVNLLSNALKHNIPWWSVEISLYKGKLVIKNTGKGIAQEEIPKIFDEFYKGDGKKEWFGIGLALVKKIANLYHWNIEVVSVLDKETTFSLYFS